VLSKYFGDSIISGRVNRVELIPIKWRNALHGDETGVNQRLKLISIGSLQTLRDKVNDTLVDVLFYMSPMYCEVIFNIIL